MFLEIFLRTSPCISHFYTVSVEETHANQEPQNVRDKGIHFKKAPKNDFPLKLIFYSLQEPA